VGGNLGRDFVGTDSEINIVDGLLGFNASLVNSTLNISGGEVEESLRVEDSQVNISGGSVNLGDFFSTLNSEINISGGVVESFAPSLGSTVNISGGTVNGFAASSSVVNISGGEFGEFFLGGEGLSSQLRNSDLTFLGSDFFLDGVSIDVAGQPVVVTDRTGTLSGVLDDGSSFSFNLGTIADGDIVFDVTGSSSLFTDSNSTITLASSAVTAVPEPSCIILFALAVSMGVVQRRR